MSIQIQPEKYSEKNWIMKPQFRDENNPVVFETFAPFGTWDSNSHPVFVGELTTHPLNSQKIQLHWPHRVWSSSVLLWRTANVPRVMRIFQIKHVSLRQKNARKRRGPSTGAIRTQDFRSCMFSGRSRIKFHVPLFRRDE